MQREPRTEAAPRSRLRRVDGIEEIPINNSSPCPAGRRRVELVVPFLPLAVGRFGDRWWMT